MSIELLGRIAPVAGSLVALVADAEQAERWGEWGDDAKEHLHPRIKEIIRSWARPESPRSTLGDVGGVHALVFGVDGWNMMAGLYRRGRDLVLVDPDGRFWEDGGAEPDEAKGPAFHEAFLAALTSELPGERELVGQITIASGSLLVADAWQAEDDEQRLTVSVAPGLYKVERCRVDCPWDEAVNTRMGMQCAVLCPIA
jgi:hypothetical protein